MWSSAPARRRPPAGHPSALRLGFTLLRGMRVGLYGGSFNPAHMGHAHVAEIARKRLGLQRVIWLVSPQNPLKPRYGGASLARRMADAARWARGPSMVVSDIEDLVGSPYTIDTIEILRARFGGVRFVWIMGGDAFAEFHRWRGWRRILEEIPVAVVSRPDEALRALSSPAARRFAFARISEGAARRLADAAPPAWVWLTAPHNRASSTALRDCS